MSNGETYSRRTGPRERHLRVGTAEREAVADILRREHVAGRLDIDEFDERVARCLAAKTYAELDQLIGDLPVDERRASGVPRREHWRRPWPLPLVFLPLLLAAIVFSHGRAIWLAAPFFFWFVVRPFFWRGSGRRTYVRHCSPSERNA